jgi:hypothetical protein
MGDSAELVARAFVRAINRQDVDGLTALMAPNHRFVDSLGTVSEGKEEIRSAWIGYFLMIPDYSLVVDETYCNGPAVVMLGMARGTYAPDGYLEAENRWETPVAIRALVENGLLIEWRVYADNEPVRQKMKRTV